MRDFEEIWNIYLLKIKVYMKFQDKNYLKEGWPPSKQHRRNSETRQILTNIMFDDLWLIKPSSVLAAILITNWIGLKVTTYCLGSQGKHRDCCLRSRQFYQYISRNFYFHYRPLKALLSSTFIFYSSLIPSQVFAVVHTCFCPMLGPGILSLISVSLLVGPSRARPWPRPSSSEAFTLLGYLWWISLH